MKLIATLILIVTFAGCPSKTIQKLEKKVDKKVQSTFHDLGERLGEKIDGL